MSQEAPSPPEPKPRKWPRRLLWVFLAFTAALVLLVALAPVILPQVMKSYAQSEGFRRMITKATNKGLKLEGEFDPLRYDGGWEISTDGFASKGRPGEAITFLNAQNVKGKFNPWAVFHGVWEVSTIYIETAQLGLGQPNDAIKVPFPVEPRPFYANLMPQRFVPSMTFCPRSDLTFSFADKEAHIDTMEVTVLPYGEKDWNISGKKGLLRMALLPELNVDYTQFITARNYLDIRSFYLSSPIPGDPATVKGSAFLGMHEDKTLRLDIGLTELPFQYALPGNFSRSVTGRANGWVKYNRTKADGSDAVGDGELSLKQLELKDLKVLNFLAKFTENEAFNTMRFDDVQCRFAMRGQNFFVDQIKLRSPGLISVEGDINVELKKNLRMDLSITELPLQNWLPAPLQRHIVGDVTGKIFLNGPIEDRENATLSAQLNLANGQIDNLPMLRNFIDQYGIVSLRNIPFRQADVDVFLAKNYAQVKSFVFWSEDLIRLTGSAELDNRESFRVRSVFDKCNLKRVLPEKMRSHFDGRINGDIDLKGHRKKPEEADAAGTFHWDDARVGDFKFLAILARFFNDDTWLELKLKPVSLNYRWTKGDFLVEKMNVECPEKIWIKGSTGIAKSGALSGELELGIHPKYLKWMLGSQHNVFSRSADGYLWASVKLSGTAKEPKIDLVSEVKSEILANPAALLTLAVKALSWWLGDVFYPEKYKIE